MRASRCSSRGGGKGRARSSSSFPSRPARLSHSLHTAPCFAPAEVTAQAEPSTRPRPLVASPLSTPPLVLSPPRHLVADSDRPRQVSETTVRFRRHGEMVSRVALRRNSASMRSRSAGARPVPPHLPLVSATCDTRRGEVGRLLEFSFEVVAFYQSCSSSDESATRPSSAKAIKVVPLVSEEP